MHQKIFNQKTALALGSAVLVLLLVVLIYVVESDFPVLVGLKKFFPAMFVGTTYVSVYDWQQNLAIASQLETKATREEIREVFIRTKQAESLAKRLRVLPTEEEVSSEFRFYRFNQEGEYQEVLQAHFDGEGQAFLESVVYPLAVEAKLKIKFNSDFQNNAVAFTGIKNIQRRIVSGENFEEIASKESDDKSSGQFGGDLGFFEAGEILPELEQMIVDSKLGEVMPDIVISRLGYHLVYPLEQAERDGKPVWHAKHILIQTQGFESWLEQEIEEIRVLKIKT